MSKFCSESSTTSILRVREQRKLWRVCAYAQMPLINAYADISSKVRCLNIFLSLQPHTYFVYASSESSGESAHMRRLARAFAARWYVPKDRALPHAASSNWHLSGYPLNSKPFDTACTTSESPLAPTTAPNQSVESRKYQSALFPCQGSSLTRVTGINVYI